MGEIIVRLDRMMAELKNGHVSAIRFSTLISLCEILRCQPGDILEYSDGS